MSENNSALSLPSDMDLVYLLDSTQVMNIISLTSTMCHVSVARAGEGEGNKILHVNSVSFRKEHPDAEEIHVYRDTTHKNRLTHHFKQFGVYGRILKEVVKWIYDSNDE